MTRFRGKFRVVASLAALFLLSGAISCRGFFVNPTLTGLTVTCPNAATCGSSPSSPNLAANGTAKLIATGNYDDGSTKILTGSADWSSGDSTKITVNNTDNKGSITAVVGSTTTPVTISATMNGTINGSVSVTVGQAANTVTCTAGCSGTTVSKGTTTSITLSASTSSTWSSSDTTIMSVTGNGASATGTTGTNTGSVTITATPTGSGFATGSITLTVTN